MIKKISLIAAFSAFAVNAHAHNAKEWDVVIYGGSSAAISAAVQVHRMGLDCVVVSPDTRIGGLTTGGLGQTDIGNKNAFGGIALEFYRDIAAWYRDENHWTHQRREDYLPEGQCAGTKGEDSMWTFEPSAALAVLEGWEKRDGLKIERGEKLDRGKGGVSVSNGRIVSFKTLSGRIFKGKMFIDATYEGDLMAAAGVSYTVGREDNSKYGETLSGCQRKQAIYHQFCKGVSAYVKPGDPSSGLLQGVMKDDGRADGTGDDYVQAYCFRMCLTDNPSNRIPFKKPSSYDEKAYELLFRQLTAKGESFYAAGHEWKLPWINSRMPNRKTDTNNRDGFSTDFVGMNWSWPEASYEEREKIFNAHLEYQRGLMWTLANHPRVPASVRKVFSRWGTCKDEFTDGPGDGWQSQLYVREARRMVGSYVMTEAHCRGKITADKPIAMAAYTMDSHHVRRIADKNGYVMNEGDVQVGRDEKGVKFPPYPIDYGSIIPKREECSNLLVPICMSASHIAFGSIRMEPVFFALGQAAGTAACQSIAAGCAVQDLPYDQLKDKLIKDGQILSLKTR
ncbi:MAG: FAD-dependent oxidoreductase [Kiritimatiellae bacterium]|nr:FAD-dependent oxidoreductase [Kiritimatiellia bacterium]